MRVSLIKPSVTLQEEYLDFYQEWKHSGETIVPWVVAKDPSNFSQMVQSILDAEKGEGLPAGWVPDSTYWLSAEDGKIVGAVNIRHRLTEKLFLAGGHIGYGIRPSERRKGYATQLLAQSLEKTRELGLERVLVVCDADNVASARTILNNGGIEDESHVEPDGNVIRRFWITLPRKETL